MDSAGLFLKEAGKLIARRSKKLEVDHEQEYCDYAKSKHCQPLKLILLGLVGFPDRTTLCPGARVLFIEFKRKPNKLSGPQKEWRDIILGLGFEYHVCYTAQEASKVLDDFIWCEDF